MNVYIWLITYFYMITSTLMQTFSRMISNAQEILFDSYKPTTNQHPGIRLRHTRLQFTQRPVFFALFVCACCCHMHRPSGHGRQVVLRSGRLWGRLWGRLRGCDWRRGAGSGVDRSDRLFQLFRLQCAQFVKQLALYINITR